MWSSLCNTELPLTVWTPPPGSASGASYPPTTSIPKTLQANLPSFSELSCWCRKVCAGTE